MQIRVKDGRLYVGDPGLARDAEGTAQVPVRNGRWNVRAITETCRRTHQAGVVMLVAVHEDVDAANAQGMTGDMGVDVVPVVVETGKMAIAADRPLEPGQYHETGWHGLACRALEGENLLAAMVEHGAVCYSRDGDGIYPAVLRKWNGEVVSVGVNFEFQAEVEDDENDTE